MSEQNWTQILCYQFPDRSSRVVKLASKVGRAFYKPEKYNVELGKLERYMQSLDNGELLYWKDVLMIRPEFSGATGQGAYIAVASRVVNEVATSVLEQRRDEWKQQYGDSLFVVEGDGVAG